MQWLLKKRSFEINFSVWWSARKREISGNCARATQKTEIPPRLILIESMHEISQKGQFFKIVHRSAPFSLISCILEQKNTVTTF